MTKQGTSNNFFIFDCNGNTVGNPGGYSTFKGAFRQQEHNEIIGRNLWGTFNLRQDKSKLEVSSIRRMQDAE
jgi:hypothetical protein